MHGTVIRRSTTTLPGASHWPTHTASWLLLVFSGGTVLSAVLQRLLLEPEQSSQRLVELNVGEMFGAVAIGSMVFAQPRLRPALTGGDFAVLLLCSLTWLVPEPHAVYAGMTFAGAWLVAKRSTDRLLAGLVQVWLALSFHELWSKLIFKLFYQAIEPLEVGLMYEVGRLFYGGLHMSGVNLSVRGDWSIVILEGCSSFHNLSLTALIWLCVLKVAGRTAKPSARRALATSASFVVAINVSRILLMLPSPEAYHFWHDDIGSTWVALASVMAAVVPIMLCIEKSPWQAPQHA